MKRRICLLVSIILILTNQITCFAGTNYNEYKTAKQVAYQQYQREKEQSYQQNRNKSYSERRADYERIYQKNIQNYENIYDQYHNGYSSGPTTTTITTQPVAVQPITIIPIDIASPLWVYGAWQEDNVPTNVYIINADGACSVNGWLYAGNTAIDDNKAVYNGIGTNSGISGSVSITIVPQNATQATVTIVTGTVFADGNVITNDPYVITMHRIV